MTAYRQVLAAALLAFAGCSKRPEVSADAGPPARAGKEAPKLCEHRVPAELCTLCKPELAEAFKAKGDWCQEHGVPESQCFLCNPRLDFGAGPEFPPPGTRIRLASPETAKEAGLRTARAERRRQSRTLEVVGQLEFNQNRFAQLSARGESLVLEVKADVGEEVKAGQPLVLLASSAVGAEQARLSASKARLEAARAAVEREAELSGTGISARKQLEEARREVAAAQAEHDSARAALDAAGAPVSGNGGRYVLVAPFAGTVVSRDAVSGRWAIAGQVLVEVADPSTLWARLDVPEAESSRIHPGQKAELTIEGLAGEAREASIARVGAAVDSATRTVPARVALPNPDRSLKAGLFLRAKVELSSAEEALLIPQEAVQQAEGRTLVFVRSEPGLYLPVAVELGESSGEWVSVVKGLADGAEVVTTGAFLLKTELLKDSIGAGCCEVAE